MKIRRIFSPTLLLLLGLALGFATLFATQNYVRGQVLHHPATWGSLYAEALPRWLFYALLAPLVGLLVDRLPLEREHLFPRLPLHVLAGVAYASTHSTLVAILYGIFHLYPRGSTLGEAILRLHMVYFAVNFVVFWTISCAYHAIRYHRETRQREILAAELRASLTEARLDALRAQLNPHFLFNTLNATSALALTGQREQVVQTLCSLSDLLRISLDRDLPQEIPLSRELGILQGYLDIQRVRFGDRLALEMDVEPAAREVLLPAMMLQPLVENALEHGVSTRPGPGRISLRARLERGRLVLRVSDTGPGFPAEAAVRSGPGGIGLANTRARLEQLYGDEQRFESGNLAGGGAFVEVSLPARDCRPGNGAS